MDAAQRYQDRGDEAQGDAAEAKSTGEDDPRSVSVVDDPADEVGVGLVTQGTFHRGHDGLKCRGMCGTSEGV